MSILQDYQEIKARLRKGEFDAIEKYLELHPELFLSDIYYNSDENVLFQKWWADNGGPAFVAGSDLVF